MIQRLIRLHLRLARLYAAHIPWKHCCRLHVVSKRCSSVGMRMLATSGGTSSRICGELLLHWISWVGAWHSVQEQVVESDVCLCHWILRWVLNELFYFSILSEGFSIGLRALICQAKFVILKSTRKKNIFKLLLRLWPSFKHLTQACWLKWETTRQYED